MCNRMKEENACRTEQRSGYKNADDVLSFAGLNTMEDCENILLLWDIDGTLMSCGGDGTKALNELFWQRTGIENALGEIRVGTAMDSTIMDHLMGHFGIPKEEREFMIDSFACILKGILNDNSNKRILPGVKKILDRLKHMNRVYMGLLTSNFKIGAELKLESVGLKDYFSFGGYGDTLGEKWNAAEIAIQSAQYLAKKPFLHENIFIIGDTVYDIQCARKLGIKCISVATGWADAQTLMNAKPDYFFDDLGNPASFYKAIFKESV